MTGNRFPNIGEPNTWGVFDASDPWNRRCETERKLAIRYGAERLKKPQCNHDALLVGMMMASAQLFAAMTGATIISDDGRVKMHELLDFALTAGVDAWNHGETRQ